MANEEFNNGDRVRVTTGCCSIEIGTTGTVRYGRFHCDGSADSGHALGDGSYSLRLELIKPEAKIEVGKEYTLLPDRKVYWVSLGRITDNVYFNNDVTRVRVIGQGQNGNYDVQSVNGRYDLGRTQLVHSSSLAEISEPKADESPEQALIEDQKRAILELQKELETTRKSLTDAINRHQKNIEIISEKFMEEAESRGWCREYDDFVRDEVNPYLSLTEMKTRVREFAVTLTFSQTISVEATDESDAIEQARESDEYGNVSSYDEDQASAEED